MALLLELPSTYSEKKRSAAWAKIKETKPSIKIGNRIFLIIFVTSLIVVLLKNNIKMNQQEGYCQIYPVYLHVRELILNYLLLHKIV